MNKLYIALAVIAIIAIGGYMMMRGQKTTSPVSENTTTVPTQVVQEVTPTVEAMEKVSPAEETMEKVVVNYTDDGFSPKSVSVKVGTPVTFINQSSTPMWVASAPHPQHTDLPGFDQLKSVEKGGEYTYTFQKAGNWKYHNHLAASNFGSVTVEE
ncbi:cupredoxin domain-containing protein [Candidatus Gottesmanbacteria bacterium]|nr:cupredoxin domain-containing protein [Candidatus Gottesmanbacteria bacterium]